MVKSKKKTIKTITNTARYYKFSFMKANQGKHIGGISTHQVLVC